MEDRAPSKLWKTSNFYALGFSSILLDPGNKVKVMTLKPIAISFIVLLCCHHPHNIPQARGKEEKADKRQNNVSGKIEFSCTLHECQGWVASGAGDQCLLRKP